MGNRSGMNDDKLRDLPNIGKVLSAQLRAIGISTPEELKAAGSRGAWLRIQAIDASACIHRLYALEGAIRQIPDNALEPPIKQELKDFYEQHKR